MNSTNSASSSSLENFVKFPILKIEEKPRLPVATQSRKEPFWVCLRCPFAWLPVKWLNLGVFPYFVALVFGWTPTPRSPKFAPSLVFSLHMLMDGFRGSWLKYVANLFESLIDSPNIWKIYTCFLKAER